MLTHDQPAIAQPTEIHSSELASLLEVLQENEALSNVYRKKINSKNMLDSHAGFNPFNLAYIRPNETVQL